MPEVAVAEGAEMGPATEPEAERSTSAGVARVRWPEEAERLARLREADHPRLLVLAPGEVPPSTLDCLEDWVFADREHIEAPARLAALQARAARHESRPRIDDDGVLRFRDGLLPLSAVEQQLVAAMVERPDGVVPREELLRRGWPTIAASQNLLDVHILRLRRRLQPLGLGIRTVRARGYALTVLPKDGAAVR